MAFIRPNMLYTVRALPLTASFAAKTGAPVEHFQRAKPDGGASGDAGRGVGRRTHTSTLTIPVGLTRPNQPATVLVASQRAGAIR